MLTGDDGRAARTNAETIDMTATETPTRPTADLLTRRDVALALRTSVTTVDRIIARGELPSLTIGDLRRVRRVDLETYIAGRVAGRN